MTNLNEYNDYELLSLIYENQEEAFNLLFEKYRPVILSKARKYINILKCKGLDINDLIQEGTIGFHQAIRDFRDAKGVQFSTFASLCIERELNTAYRKATRHKHQPLNDSMSLDYTYDEESNMFDFVVSENDTDPLDDFINLEHDQEIIGKIREELTDFEAQVFELKMNNFTYKEIAQILDKSIKSVDNALQRIKLKVRKFVEK